MKAFEAYRGCYPPFWALVKLVSESLGYKKRGADRLRTYSYDEIEDLFFEKRISSDANTIELLKSYTDDRASVLNDVVQYNLMDATAAENAFNSVYPLYEEQRLLCSIPMNKQKGAMKKPNFFTAVINILTELTLREMGLSSETHLGFDDDPRSLSYILSDDGNLLGASSRRYDGAIPSVMNPLMVWEIKEYYYATTFGSRVADGVYETQLDGYEFRDIFANTGYKVHHTFFLDAYKTWWIDGKSYLCRVVDMLNAGLVDEVIFGQEVFERWPDLLREKLR